MERVKRLDLTMVKLKLMDPEEGHGWSPAYTDEVERTYKNWLILVGSSPEQSAVPIGDIDRMWHQHILDTRKYPIDSDMLFGYFLHHDQYFGMRGEEDRCALEAASEETRVRYRTLFGEEICGGLQRCDSRKCRSCRQCGSSCREVAAGALTSAGA